MTRTVTPPVQTAIARLRAPRRNLLSVTIVGLMSASLAACGGGGGTKQAPVEGTIVGNGGGTAPAPAPAPSPSPSPAPAPAPTPAPPSGEVCADPRASNAGASAVCDYAYSGAADNLLVPTGIAAARAQGLTGEGVKLAILDSELVDGYGPLQGRISAMADFTGQPADAAGTAKGGHGTVMAALAAGQSSGQFKGGSAPGAELYMGRVCANDACASTHITQAVQDFTAQGVRLFNLSLGSSSSQAGANAYIATGNAVLAADALLVAATGNAGRAQPDNPAGVPVHHAQFKDNWLAVANLRIDRQGQPGNLNSLSNACGDAALFCLAAPGLQQIEPLANSAFANAHHADGTSASTAVVTGAAALVWQAFPWMSASNLQQTLLTTAVDLGQPGVDATYGWGLLDTAAAVRGPGQFTAAFAADVPAGQSGIFSNDISGNGSLVKNGAGTLVLAGNNTYKGNTHIAGGNLELSGDLAGDLSTGPDARLLARGGRVHGNYAADASAITGIQIGLPLQVGGRAQLDGVLSLHAPAAGYPIASSESLLAAGQIDGRFASILYANDLFWDATLEYTATAVNAQMQRSSATASTQTQGAAQAVVNGARQADALVAELDRRASTQPDAADTDPIWASTSSLLIADQQQATHSLATLSAPLLGMERQATLSADLGHLRTLSDRIHTTVPEQRGVQVQAQGLYGQLDHAGYGRGEWSLQGIGAAVTAPLEDGHWGVALDQSRMQLRAAAGDHSDADQTRVSGWLQHRTGALSLSAVAGAGRSAVDSQRLLIAGQSSEQARSQRVDHSAHLRIDAGWQLDAHWTPYVAAGALHHRQGAFNEHSRSGLGLAAQRQSATLAFVESGMRANWQGEGWQLGASLAYQRLLAGNDLGYRAAFDGLTTTRFDVAGINLPGERWRAGVGGAVQLTPTLHIEAAANAEIESGRGHSLGAELGLRWAF